MKMKRFLKYFILILVVISCSKENGNSDKQNTPEFDRSTVLVNLADNIIIPNYNAFQGKMNELKSYSKKFISELESENKSSNYALKDVAPTILKILGISYPDSFTGESII